MELTEEMEEMEEQIFGIISAVGTAKSCYIEAIQEAKKGNIDAARELISEGNSSFVGGHKIHAALLEKEMSGNHVPLSLIILHAEDQIMAADSFKIIANSFIDLYEQIQKK
jgi:PTS system cellobiose-specific IIA component